MAAVVAIVMIATAWCAWVMGCGPIDAVGLAAPRSMCCHRDLTREEKAALCCHCVGERDPRAEQANFDARELGKDIPAALKAYAAGLAFALAASPCSTPVLATLLGYVASSGDPVTGGALLFTYTSGYVAPLLVAATATGSLKNIMSARQYTFWVTPASGFALVAGGTYGFLTRVAPYLSHG